MLDLFTTWSSNAVVAASAITWTPLTFYVAMGIVHTIAVLVGYRVMQVDVEHNSFIGAVLAAGLINVVAYFTKDTGVVGVLITGAAMFGMLVLIASGEGLKAAGMSLIAIALYGLVGSFIVSRTPLTIDEIAGLPRVVATGGLEAEPITEDDYENVQKTGLEKEEDWEDE